MSLPSKAVSWDACSQPGVYRNLQQSRGDPRALHTGSTARASVQSQQKPALSVLERGASWPGSGSLGGGGALERATEAPESVSMSAPHTSSTSKIVRADWYTFLRSACITLPKGLGTLSEAPNDFVNSEKLLTSQLKKTWSPTSLASSLGFAAFLLCAFRSVYVPL